MKNVVLGFLGFGLWICLFSGFAMAETGPLLLNYQEWSSLSPDQQLQYLKDLQQVMASMDQRSEFFAQAKSETASTRAPASASVDLSEQYVTVTENNLLTADQTLKNADKIKDTKKKTTELKKAAQIIEQSRYGISLIKDERLAAATYKKWTVVRKDLVKEKLNPPLAEIGRIEKVDNIFKTLSRASTTIASSEKLLAKSTPGTLEYNKLSAEIANNKAALKGAAEEFKKNKADFSSAQTAYSAAAAKLSKKKDGDFFRCMYAGFVLKGDCKAPTQLPKDLKLVGITPDHFSCDKSLVLCNPLIFGGAGSCPVVPKMKKQTDAKCLIDMKGFCKPKSNSATKDCLEEAEKSPHNLENTALLIHANPDAWNEYTNSFHELCDEEKIAQNSFTKKKGSKNRTDQDHVKQDIEKTCGWARERLLKLRNDVKIDLKKIDSTKLDVGQKKAPETGRK